MKKNFIAKASVTINAPRARVWNALLDPDAIKQYLFGTQVTTDWKRGSPISWKGEWKGKPYEDKGVVLQNSPGRKISYTYFSSLSGAPDIPENYGTVAIELSGRGNKITVSLTQDKNPTKEARDHSSKNWETVLGGLKKLVEEMNTPKGRPSTQKITPFLWFNTNAEEAMNFYISIFNNSKVLSVARYGDEGPGPAGSVMTATFQLEGQDFVALNGGPQFSFTPAISFYVDCVSQKEVDRLWEQLSEGGEKGQCGWLKDKFGVSWQIIPRDLGILMSDPDRAKAGRVMQAMLQMTRIDTVKLRQAYDHE